MVPSVLVFSGLDPGGGAGLAADIQSIAAQRAHALPVATALTVQDNNNVFEVVPVASSLLARQAQVLADSFAIGAVKIGIPGNLANAMAIADVVRRLRGCNPALPVVLDPVLASGAGQPLAQGDALAALAPLLEVASVVVPNRMESDALGVLGEAHVLVTGGHDDGELVVNQWLHRGALVRAWRWTRLPGQFHGSGCTLAAAIAARLARGDPMELALGRAQAWCHATLVQSFSIAPGQRIPRRFPMDA